MSRIAALYQYSGLSGDTSFRLLELLPGTGDDVISVVLHSSDLADHPAFDAVSYTWGNPNSRASFLCDGKRVEATTNLHTALIHLRLEEESRYLWVDALCINQDELQERAHQVKHMRRIYSQANSVLIWLGRDSRQYQAKLAVDSVRQISDFLCERIGIPPSELRDIKDPFHDILVKNRELVPLPNTLEFANDAMWKALLWFYSHRYLTRVWIIQEINVSSDRILHCGYEHIEWERVDLVAGYIIMETAFSREYRFSDSFCWWAASLTEIALSKSWLFMLYLASNFSCMDHRDFVYGLRGLMKLSQEAYDLLLPDYHKSVTEVYRDSVEAALLNFKNTDVLYYIGGAENPSWIPRWDKAMLFRNPFRLATGVPWKPTGETEPIWNIDKERNVLSLSGIKLGTIQYSEPYNEGVFGELMLSAQDKREKLRAIWSRVFSTFEKKFPAPFTIEVLIAAAVSLSFGLDEKKLLADEQKLLLNFAAYLRIALDEPTFGRYIPRDIADRSKTANGHAFGKPVWDFEYPESSIYITQSGLIGCTISETTPGDVVFAALGSSYPLVLRPSGSEFRIRGYSYVHGIMNAEKEDSEVQNISIC